uniref:Uncharacterized protein n=1 Tax=Arundo donax TaxID=35708 RepID=A0A0A9GGD5_ARUDO
MTLATFFSIVNIATLMYFKLNMLVISIPTKMIFTGNQTLISFHVNCSVGIAPDRDSVETIVTDTIFW